MFATNQAYKMLWICTHIYAHSEMTETWFALVSRNRGAKSWYRNSILQTT